MSDMARLHWEDFHPGQVFTLPDREVTREEILGFARAYDPQPFHVDETAAAASPFGGLIASGWHTAALFMRMYVDGVLSRSTSQGSPGLEQLRWLAPVRPGDVLRGRVEVLETTPSTRHPGRGTVVMRWEVVRVADGATVMTMVGRGLFGRRSPGEVQT